MDKNDVIKKAKESDVKIISFLYCDNGGIIRSKSTHISNLEGNMESGIGMSVAMPAMSSIDTLQNVEGMGPVGEIRMVPDPNTFKILPYAPKWATMMSDMQLLDHSIWSACTRGFLQRMIKKAGIKGLRVKAAFEPEWTLATKQGNNLFVPCDESLCYSTIGMSTPRKVIEEIVDALESQGMQVENYYPELGHGQQELSIRFDDALTSADNHIVYRETVRNVAFKHGFIVSFAPKPFANQAGNGCHIHLSVWDADGMNNLFYSPTDKINLSDMAYQFISGIIAHLPGLVALTCPSVNSYRRLKPQAWSSAYACYGPDNREAAVRIPSPFWGREKTSINIELKAADASANPYIALGGLIAAGLDGIETGVRPHENLFLEVDPATLSEEECNRRGIYRLPDSLSKSVSALESDSCLADALGFDLLTSYVAVRKGEISYYADQDDDFELRNHFYKY